MEYAKIFSNGGSQAVRLPKSCRFDQDEVLVNRIGKAVILLSNSRDLGARSAQRIPNKSQFAIHANPLPPPIAS